MHRNQRCRALLFALPAHDSTKPGKNAQELLRVLDAQYRECASDSAKLRAIQRDLQTMRKNGEIVLDPSSSNGVCYRRAAVSPDFQSSKANITQLQADLNQLGLAPDLVAYVLGKVQHPTSFFDLPDAQFVRVADTIRLTPASEPDADIQAEILQALRTGRVLKASYRKPEEEAQDRRLHLLGVVQRGAQYYVIAYDDKDLGAGKSVAKMFLLTRFVDAAALNDEPSRLPPGTSLQSLIDNQGLADFVHNPKPVTVKIRVKEYVWRLLTDNRLSDGQTIKPAKDGQSAIVTAKLPLSGTLYRWLLGFGDKVEVLQPKSLRRTIAWQASAATDYYEDVYAEDDGEGEEDA